MIARALGVVLRQIGEQFGHAARKPAVARPQKKGISGPW